MATFNRRTLLAGLWLVASTSIPAMSDVRERPKLADADELIIRALVKKLSSERIIELKTLEDGQVEVKTERGKGEGFLDGSGHYFIFKRKNGKWIKKATYIWIS